MKLIAFADFGKVVKYIRSSTGRRVEHIHVALCSMLVHAAEHGDHSPMSDLVGAVSNAERKAIALWLPVFAPLEVRDGRVVKNRKPDANEYAVEAAQAVSYDAYKAPRRDEAEFGLVELIKLLEKKADAKNADPEVVKYATRFANMIRTDANLAEENAAKAQADVNGWAQKPAPKIEAVEAAEAAEEAKAA
jgi:hypothetical protein